MFTELMLRAHSFRLPILCPHMPRVREINDVAELAGLRSIWHRLLAETPGATFFSTPEWLEVYWRHFGAGQRLRVLVVEAGGQICGILPLVVRQERRRLGRIATLAYPLDYWGSFYGPIGPDRRAILTAGLRRVSRTARDWDVIDLGYVDERDIDRCATRDALRRTGFQAHRRVRDHAPLVRLPATFEIYLAERTAKWRENRRRGLRKIARRGGFRYERAIATAGRPAARWDLYRACEEVARRSWQGRSTTGTTLCHATVRSFLTSVHEVADPLGAADVNVLWRNDEPVAFAYNYVWRGTVCGLRMGYDPRWAGDGIGRVLLDHLIRDSIQRGHHTFDLGPGSLETKRHWQTEVKPVVQFSHYHPLAPRAQLLRMKHVLGWMVEPASLVDW